jgi:hypothetical protein
MRSSTGIVGSRLRGELFADGLVQKIRGEGGVLGLFTHYVRYPRTYHLPWSPGLTDDISDQGQTTPKVGLNVHKIL